MDAAPGLARARLLAWLALLGVGLYVAIDIALRFLHPAVNLLRDAESDYGNGPYSWLMDVNFEIRFLLSVAAAAAIWSAFRPRGGGRAGVILLLIWAVGSAVLGFFRDDLPGAPLTRHGELHLAAAAIAFVACLLGTLLLLLDFRHHALMRPWGLLLVPVWVLGLLSLIALLRAGFGPGSLGGLFERVFIGAQLAWFAIASARIVIARRADAGIPGPPGMARA
ncbi:MAG: DUF998 domain-containing protein [Candidatus Dormibacteraceae bacterium]